MTLWKWNMRNFAMNWIQMIYEFSVEISKKVNVVCSILKQI